MKEYNLKRFILECKTQIETESILSNDKLVTENPVILGAVRNAENEADIISDFSSYIYQLFVDHPSGVAKKKLHVVYLKALGLPHQEIIRIARVSGDSVTRYLQAYIEGGVTALCSSPVVVKLVVARTYEFMQSF